MERSQELPGWWVLVDMENSVVVKFKEYDFNKSQKITFLDDDETAINRLGVLGLARVVREMGEYLSENYYGIMMPPTTSKDDRDKR